MRKITGCICYIFATLLFKSKREYLKLGKMFFVSLWNLFSFSRKSMFRILNIQILSHHQMPKQKTRNAFYWINWKMNSLLMKFGQLMSYQKIKNVIKIFYKNFNLKTSSRPFCFCKKSKVTSATKLFFVIEELLMCYKWIFFS